MPTRANPPLDAKAEKLLRRVQENLNAMLAAGNGTTLSVTQPRLVASIDELAKHRYAQIGVMDAQATKR